MTIFLVAIMMLSMMLLLGTGQQMLIQKEIGGTIICCGLMFWWIWKYNKWLSLFLLWCLIRLFLPPSQPRGALNMINITMAGMVYLAIQNYVIDKSKFYKAIAIVTGIHIIVIFLQLFNLFPFWNYINNVQAGRVWGLFGNSNFSGCFIAITAPVYLELAKKQRLYYLAIIAGLISLIIMDSMFPIVAFISAIGFYYYFTYREKILKTEILRGVLALIIILTVLIIIKPIHLSDDVERLETWRRVWMFMVYGGETNWHNHFTQGYGLGSTYELLPRLAYTVSDQKWYQAHNEILQCLMELGLIGVFLASGIVINAFRKINNNNIVLLACLFAVLIESIGFFIFHISPMGYISVIYLGLVDKNQ